LSWSQALQKKVDTALYISGRPLNSTQTPPGISDQYITNFYANESKDVEFEFKEEGLRGWWQWQFTTHIDGQVIKTRTPNLAVTHTEWQQPLCWPKHSKTYTHQECVANGKLPGLKATYSEFSNAECWGEPLVMQPRLGSHMRIMRRRANRQAKKTGKT